MGKSARRLYNSEKMRGQFCYTNSRTAAKHQLRLEHQRELIRIVVPTSMATAATQNAARPAHRAIRAGLFYLLKKLFIKIAQFAE
jgi:hypothetical protein